MPELAIITEKLGKSYTIGTQDFQNKRLSDAFTAWVTNPLQQFRRLAKGRNTEVLWALKDVCLEVNEGEILGIVGRNGAGKSTLLKILSRITEPTEGTATIHGRLASLLEVGIGFHPDLTGRENIYLNGVILGMTKAEVARKFDEIVHFSEVAKFLDTPMKHYSSGMYVRLAFAVAAHLEPHILVIDEVLAVGDAAFQNKCIGKIDDVAKQGRTVLFVSHNMPAVMSLCTRAILLSDGHVVADGAPKMVLDRYLESIEVLAATPLMERTDRMGNRSLQFVNCQLVDSSGNGVGGVVSGDDMTLALTYKSRDGKPLRAVHVEAEVYGRFHESLFQLSTSIAGSDFDEIPGHGVIKLTIPRLPVQAGKYTFDLYCTVSGTMADYIQHVAEINVETADYFGSGKLPLQGHGNFLVLHKWQCAPVDERAAAHL